ncbi:hypothetical protein E1B28_000747 [Marasmius oreades]|uniref:PH domain-containing protein n=1 Tax=Marasmius oreades TaxID=181124 RepID=A0A9P7V1Z7_9AGAR|nr:uncharacterized protein E1B28_000747 [Marasmius oreades]KAG7098844.1 hypothetical protein E1B28_000747 [Marasmius oreades]
MLGPREMEGTKSTKQLIHRYESLQYTPFVSKPASSPSVFKRLSSLSTKTDKSAVRQSFRNLMGLLKKANNKLKAEPNHQKNYIHDLTVPGDTAPLPMERTASQSSASSTGSTRSGPLLYLSRIHHHSWIPCFATLEETRILLSWSTEQESDQYSVLLKHCIDVRSLTQNQVDVEDITLPPPIERDEDYKVFEILYQNEPREIFAVISTRERARWISCIWDAVLSAQEAKSAFRQSLVDQTFKKSTLDTAKPLPDVGERALPMTPIEPLDVATFEPSIPNTGSNVTYAEVTALAVDVQNPSIATSSNHPLPFNEPSLDRRSTNTLESIPMRHLDSGQSAGYSIIDAYHDESRLTDHTPHPVNSLVSSDFKVLQDHLTRLADREQLDDKFLSLQLNIQNIPKELARSMNLRNEHVVTTLEHITHLVSNADSQFSNTHAMLQSIDEKLQGMEARSEEQVPREHSDNAQTLQALEALRTSLASELAQVLGKLEDVAKLSAAVSQRVESPSSSAPLMQPEVAEILKILKEEETHRMAQTQQQADSVRYLNELNIWLEAFVNNGTSHIHGMSASLKRLCDGLGLYADGSDQGKNLIASVHQLVQDTRVREQHAATLQETVNSIAIHLNSSVGHIVSPQTLAQLMDKHRQEHEVLLKTLTEELSQEIRGERLRFVEAMKEATAINVHMHVEEFKKELKREVHGMTQEVSRLYREKQNMENQIAELFAFHAKQRSGIPKGINSNHIPPDYGGIPRYRASPSDRG